MKTTAIEIAQGIGRLKVLIVPVHVVEPARHPALAVDDPRREEPAELGRLRVLLHRDKMARVQLL